MKGKLIINKNGFTVIEVIIAFSITTVLLVALISFTVKYRDKISENEIKMQLLDYKNNITKLVYDDIVNGKYNKIEQCIGHNKQNGGITCITFSGSKNTNLEIIRNNNGSYLRYNNLDYLLPDSDIHNASEDITLCDFIDGFTLNVSSTSPKFYTLKLSYKHMNFNQDYDIMIMVN